MESPPPTMLVAPASVASATAFATASVPLANSSHSNTPIGPFQMIVFAPFSASTYASDVFGPLSSACQPFSTLSTSTTFVLPSEANFASSASGNMFATATSSGRMTLTPFAFAFSRSSFARSILSGSHSESPIASPLAASNVCAMPPPMMIVSTFSIMLLMTPILSETFAPPMMATKGCAGASSVLPM